MMNFVGLKRGAGRLGATILALGMLVAGAAAALPDRPVRVVVPFPPGGGSDAVARIVVEGLAPLLPRGAVVENRSGANGMIGMAEVARAPADGSILALCFMGPCALNPSLYANQPYDLLRDFAPVVMIGASQNVMTVPASVPAATLAEYVALMRQRGAPLTFASSGVGSTTHLGAELFRAWANCR